MPATYICHVAVMLFKTNNMFRLVMLIVTLSLLSCQQNGFGEFSSKRQPKNQASFHQTSYQTKNLYLSPEIKSISGNEPEIDWMGSWQYEQDKVKYSLTIVEKQKELNKCIYHVEGIPAFYILECNGIMKGNIFELYFRYTNDGNFFKENKIDRHKPILTLALVNGKVITYWNQLPGGRNGQECFKKKV